MSIIDVSNPSNPFRLSSVGLPGNGVSTAVSGHYMYVSYINNNFGVIDISDPRKPFLATTSTGILSASAQSMHIIGKYLYASETTYNTNLLTIVDISNPLTPVEVKTVTGAGFNPAGASTVSDGYAYIVEDNTLYVIDVSNPSTASVVKTLSVAGVNDLAVSGKYLYAAGNNSLYIIDISNPLNLTLVKTVYSLTGANNVNLSGHYVYVTGNGTLYIIDIQGIETNALFTSSLTTGNLQILNNAMSQGSLSIGTSLTVGEGGILSSGSLSISSTSTPSNFGGKVGIGSSTNPATALQVFGDIRVGTAGTNGCIQGFGGTALTGTCSSDERLKTNILEIASTTFEKFADLKVVNYEWNDLAATTYQNPKGVSNLGYTAQNVESIFPELVTLDSNGYKQVNYNGVLMYAVEAIKELSSKFKNGLTYIKNVIAESLTVGSPTKPIGITVYDDYGKPACMSVREANSGSVRVTPGECGVINLNQTQQVSIVSTPVTTPVITPEVPTSISTTTTPLQPEVSTTTATTTPEISTPTPIELTAITLPIIESVVTTTPVVTLPVELTTEVSTSTTPEPETISTSSAASILIPVEAVKNFLLNLFGLR